VLRQIIGEKRSLKVLLEMVKYGLMLLECKTKEEAIEKHKKEGEKSYGIYIERDILRLHWE